MRGSEGQRDRASAMIFGGANFRVVPWDPDVTRDLVGEEVWALGLDTGRGGSVVTAIDEQRGIITFGGSE